MSIVINGGGMTGVILALILSKLTKGNLKIHLIEQNDLYNFGNLLSLNIPSMIALSRGAYHELIHINIDIESIFSLCSTVIKRIEISEYGKFNTVSIDAQDYQVSELGYVIESNIFRKKLFDLLYKESTVSIYSPATLEKIERENSINVITLSTGERITSKLIIAADGMCSVLAAYCGMTWLKHDYQQIAIVTKVLTEIPHYGRAFEQSTHFGSLALLPISNNHSMLIWCISRQNKRMILTWSKSKFTHEIQNVFGWKLGKIINVGTRHFYNLWLTQATNHIAHRLALVGNAAQSLHPIAGQGFNLGLRDVIVLSKIIEQALYQNLDIGDYSVLNTYREHRYSDQNKMINITNGLMYLFNNHHFLITVIRNIGFFCIRHSSLLQYFIINQALSWKTNGFVIK